MDQTLDQVTTTNPAVRPTGSPGDLVVLLYPISWLAIGHALFGGLPTSESGASSRARGR